ncbi:uncharacterized protein LOC128282072 [Gossypium arboreum]|uniref:uncharacterized protein LOC128282072 n=1 Tax=Gossypium arboreum TaxID=29729 RepID=UPI0022F1D9B8|nr:uncharacterized protein LOC128282072 [Gossypium arboreum]
MRETQVSSKRSSGKMHPFPSKKLRGQQERSTASVGYSGKTRSSKRHNSKSSSPMVTSVGSVDDQKSRYKTCNKFHFGECRMKSGACYRCGSLDHFLRDFLERANKEVELALKPNALISRVKPLRHPRSASGSRIVAKDATAKLEARAPTRTYAIRAREEASAPEVITGIFSIYNTRVIALIDPGSTYSYICMKLVSSMNMSVEPTEFVIKVSNPLGNKYIELKCSGGEILRIDSSELDTPPVVIFQ